MTYEEFKQLAEHPQHRDVPAIFKLEVLETEELEEKKRSHYPKYKVNTYCPQAFTTTLEKERMMDQMGGAPQMPGMGTAVPQVQYFIGINGQQYGPYDWNKLQQLVQQGQFTQQSYVWKNGMAQWEFAGNVAELAPLFQGTAPQMPGMPPTMPGM